MDPLYYAPGIFMIIAAISFGVAIMAFVFDQIIPIVIDHRKTAGTRIGAAASAVLMISVYCFMISLFDRM